MINMFFNTKHNVFSLILYHKSQVFLAYDTGLLTQKLVAQVLLKFNNQHFTITTNLDSMYIH